MKASRLVTSTKTLYGGQRWSPAHLGYVRRCGNSVHTALPLHAVKQEFDIAHKTKRQW